MHLLSNYQNNEHIHVLDFSKFLDAEGQVLPVLSVEQWKVTDPNDIIIKKSFGKWGHYFVLTEVEGGQYLRTKFNGGDPFNDYPISQTVIVSDDPKHLTQNNQRLAVLRNRNTTASIFPLGRLAHIIERTHAHTHKYDLFGRNCIWFSETILYTVARVAVQHWAADNAEPCSIVDYMHGQISCIDASSSINVPSGSLRILANVSITALKATQAWFSFPAGESRCKMPDEEVATILAELECSH